MRSSDLFGQPNGCIQKRRLGMKVEQSPQQVMMQETHIKELPKEQCL